MDDTCEHYALIDGICQGCGVDFNPAVERVLDRFTELLRQKDPEHPWVQSADKEKELTGE